MENKTLSTEEVPQKFMEWLLVMGCPPDKVPSLEKVQEICRGQYYMVWRSLMQRVHPKDTIKIRNLQVFVDDIRRFKEKVSTNESDACAIAPEELKLWKKHMEVKQSLADTESRVGQARQELNQSLDKAANKLVSRNLLRRRVQDKQRRVWLLQRLKSELEIKKEQLLETRVIAESLTKLEEDNDLPSKLDKCVSAHRRQAGAAQGSASLSICAGANPVANSTVVSTASDCGDAEEQVWSSLRCRGEALWPQLCERRAALVASLAAAAQQPAAQQPAAQQPAAQQPAAQQPAAQQPAAQQPAAQQPAPAHRSTTERVLAQTAALQCSLALETLKNRANLKQARKRLAEDVAHLNSVLSGSACELVVVRCEQAGAETRARTLRRLLAELTARRGVFRAPAPALPEQAQPAPDGGAGPDLDPAKLIADIDKAIMIKKCEVNRNLDSLAVVERKVLNVRECLLAVFDGFRRDAPLADTFRGVQLDVPQESVVALRRFYEERRDRRRRRAQLSFDLSASAECSDLDPLDNPNPTFVDELKIYLKTFTLENNRKLVLESGEKIWIFETLQSSMERECSDRPLCAGAGLGLGLGLGLGAHLRRLARGAAHRDRLKRALQTSRRAAAEPRPVPDVKPYKEQEEHTIDKIKKRLNEDLLSLQKISKTLDLGLENLKLWSDDHVRKCIDSNRTVDGMTYKRYESLYLDNMKYT